MRKIGVGIIVGLAFTAFGGSAHAATLRVDAKIKGSGTILVGRDQDLFCDQSANLDSRAAADCASVPFFGPSAEGTQLIAVAPAGNPESKFVRWSGCDSVFQNVCNLHSGASAVTAKAPVAEFADTTNPVVTLAPIPARVGTADVPLNFTVNDPHADTTCKIDGQARACKSGPQTLADGQHTVQVQAFDPSGNGASSSTYTFTVDSIAPKVTFTKLPARNSSDASITFDVTKSATTTCALDRGAFKPCAGSFTASGLADGSHLIEVKANDGLHETVINKAWTIDTTTPTIAFEMLASPLSTSNVKITWKASEPATFTCSLDGAAPVKCSNFTADNLLDGPHTLTVTASDGVNTGTYEQRFVIDAHPIGTAISIQG